MKRRDFIKGAAAMGAGALATGVVPGKSAAGAASASGNTFGNIRKGVKFYRIDAYCHFAPMDYIKELESLSGRTNPQRSIIQPIPSLWDVADRLSVMDKTGVDVSIFTPQPFIETAGPGVYQDAGNALTAAQYINDEMAELAGQYPDRFKWVALLPGNLALDLAGDNYNTMIKEFKRAVDNGAVGACITVSPTLKPPDHEDYVGNPSTGKLGLFGVAEQMNVPIWIHPARPLNYPDYQQDVPPLSKYYLWLLLGWMLDTSVAMARIVFANVFGNYPDVKLIMHHKGALVPLYQNRLTYDLYNTPAFLQEGFTTGIPADVSQPYLDQFKKFYVDTVFCGNASFETEIVQIARDFFGPDHVLFGTDASFSTNDGADAVLNARYSVEALSAPDKDIQDIFANNFLKIIPQGGGIPKK